MKLEVLHPGLSTTIQDSGRINGLAYGVPKGGAMDLKLMYLANRLVGNPITNPVLELTMQGGQYRFGGDSIIAVTGRGDAFINSDKIELNSRVFVNKGDVLNFYKIRLHFIPSFDCRWNFASSSNKDHS